MSAQASNAAGKILHNSLWYGLETIIETVVFLGTSIAVARHLGPQKLGYFSYINFFVLIVTRTSGTGLASATRTYMSEFLALDRPGTARAVYRLAYKYQLVGAVAISALGIGGIVLFGQSPYRTMACILILSIIPGVMSWVPAQANQAFEDVSQNTLSAFGFIFAYAVMIALSLHFHWDLIGIASASLVGRTVEVILRTIPLNRKLALMPLDVLDLVLVRRIRRYCLESIGIQLLMSVVWDRSEMFFLRAFCSLEQIAFYSVSFGLANNLLVIPRTFGNATGITLMVEANRDPTRVSSIVRNASRYLLFIVFPVHLGAAAITREAITVTYGLKYIDAVPVLMVASILAMPRAFQEIAEVLLRAADRQQKILRWYLVTGIINVALDAILIDRYGAVGAAWGNGLAQTFGVIAVWQAARRAYTFSLPISSAVRLLFSALAMAALAFTISKTVGGVAGLVLAICAAVPTYLLLVRLTHGLHSEDRDRLMSVGDRLPLSFRRTYLAAVSLITPASS